MENLRKVLVRLRTKKVTANPAKTRLGLKEVEYVGHLISSTGTSFTPEKRLQVLDFPLLTTQKVLLQFIGRANYLTEMTQLLRKLIDIKRYKGSNKLIWTEEGIEAFQELYFLDDTTTPTDYGIGGYMSLVIKG